MAKSWAWRKARGGWKLDSDHGWKPEERIFHAYDVNDNAACEPSCGLAGTAEDPNEGSEFCPACMEFVRANPAGKEKRVYPTE